MNKRGIYFIIAFVIFLLSTSSVSAHWFQTVSGDVYSNGSINIRNSSQGGTPTSFLSASSTERGTSGVVTYIASSNIFGTERASQDDTNSTNIDQRWAQQRATDNSPLYVAPSAQANFYTSLRDKFETSTLHTSGGINDPNTYCRNLSTGWYTYMGSLTINDCPGGSNFGPDSGEKIVIFVSGPVIIRDTITVPNAPNTFFMIVSSTSITFHNDVFYLGSALNPTPAIGGVYVAPVINTSNDSLFVAEPLIAEGIFYALNQFNLNRRTSDQLIPSETFLYKPSLMVSAPQELWDTFSEYQEVEP